MQHFLSHWLGLDNASGAVYLWWSGFVGDLGYLAIVATLLRRHQCEVNPCWRLARHSTNGGHRVCARHHPEGAPTSQDVIDKHEENRSV